MHNGVRVLLTTFIIVFVQFRVDLRRPARHLAVMRGADAALRGPRRSLASVASPRWPNRGRVQPPHPRTPGPVAPRVCLDLQPAPYLAFGLPRPLRRHGGHGRARAGKAAARLTNDSAFPPSGEAAPGRTSPKGDGGLLRRKCSAWRVGRATRAGLVQLQL